MARPFDVRRSRNSCHCGLVGVTSVLTNYSFLITNFETEGRRIVITVCSIETSYGSL